jgi:hypothetical protein
MNSHARQCKPDGNGILGGILETDKKEKTQVA